MATGNRGSVVISKIALKRGALPSVATIDAYHISLSAVYGIHFLLTLNFAHIANAATEETLTSDLQRT